MQVVIDTNIIVSALLNPSGACYIFLDRVFAGAYDVVISEAIIEKYSDVLRRPRFGFAEEDVCFIVDWFIANALMVEVNEEEYADENSVDKKDIPFLEYLFYFVKCKKLKCMGNKNGYYKIVKYIKTRKDGKRLIRRII